MRLLIDTHVIIWWVMAPDTLSKTVDDLLLDPATQVLVSPVSAFEISRKYGLGKLAFDQAFIADFDLRIRALGWLELPLTNAHAVAAGRQVGSHKDPFDRMIAAQAIVEGLTIATLDPAIEALGATVVW